MPLQHVTQQFINMKTDTTKSADHTPSMKADFMLDHFSQPCSPLRALSDCAQKWVFVSRQMEMHKAKLGVPRIHPSSISGVSPAMGC